MDLGQALGEQTVAAHHEEDAGLREQQHQDDRGQREERRDSEHVAHARETDLAQHMRQRLVRADQRSGVLRHRALQREFFRPGGEGNAARTHDRLPADRADRARRHQDVEHGAEQQRTDQADRHVALRVLGLFGRGRNRIEADIGEEDRRRRADRADPGTETAEHAGGEEGVELVGVELGAGEGQRDEDGERDHLDHDQHCVDAGAFIGADHQKPGDQQRYHHRRQIDEAARFAAKRQRPGRQP